METSALDATNVNKAFHDLLKEIYKDMRKNKSLGIDYDTNNGIDLDTNNRKKKFGCC